MFAKPNAFPGQARGDNYSQALHTNKRELGAEERFQLLVESVTDCGITMLDDEGCIASWNSGAHLIHGYCAEEIIGQPFSKFFLQEDIDAGVPESILRDATNAGRSEENGWRIRKDGSKFWANLVITAIHDADGVLRGYAKLTRDMTEQKAAVEAVKESEARIRSILDTVPDAIVITDEQGLIESFSPAATRLFGYSLKQVVGQNVKMLIPAPYRDQLGGYLSRFRETGEKQVIGTGPTIVGLRQDGTTFPMELAVAEVLGGKRRLFTGFVRDMTERHRVESELSKAKALAEAANQAKSDFLSSMSHELRTPLNAILGFAQLMQSDSPAPSPNQTASIDQILQAGWYLLTLINEVLDLSLIESGKLTLSLVAVSVEEVLQHCHAMIEPLAQKRGIALDFPKFDRPYVVFADRTRLQQVLVNLLSNSIKYNRTNGSVTVECVSQPPGQVRISVRDTGMGMAPERLEHLYQPFNRLGQEAGLEQGTGIGLVVTKRIVEAMRGTIGVESKVDVGTTFWVDLAKVEAAQFDCANRTAPSTQCVHANDSVPTHTVLYVEDNPANLKLVERLIARRADLTLLTAGTGDLGVDLARVHQPDVILMDINLPGISGTKALALLQQETATARIPVVALSANASPRDIERGLAAGFLKYLTKPIKVDELMATLDFVLQAGLRPKTTELSVPHVA